MKKRSISCIALAAGLASGLVGSANFGAFADPASQNDPWPAMVRDIFQGRELADGARVLAIEMPGRAEDAAIVPLTIRSTLPSSDSRQVRSFTVVIDENPAPVAAVFHIGPGAIVPAISTRVRVNSYTSVHAVAELSDGTLHAVSTYVKASGGCSAPAAKNADRAGFGQLRFRQFAGSATTGNMREAQIMVQHPNNSGLQMDQVTRLYVPAFFVQSIKIWQGEDLLLAIEGSISISEDPNMRFTFLSNGSGPIRAEVIDTKQHVFKGEWPIAAAAMESPAADD
jgi:sulfur-oxidizing protein SoxY